MTGRVGQASRVGGAGATALAGARICLVFEPALAQYSRLLEEIEALQQAGANVHWLTSDPGPDEPPLGVTRLLAPLDTSVAGSTASWRPLRVALNLAKDARASAATRLRPDWTARRRLAALRWIAPRVDLFWVIDFPSLPTVMAVAPATGVRVVYETVDLVPEYDYFGEDRRRRDLECEGRLVGQVDGFITACDSYADYYVERYGPMLGSPPVVRDNMPAHIVERPAPTRRPLRLLFLGAILFDRPVEELIRAMALVTADVTLTFQGKNHLGEAPQALIDDLGLRDRITIAGPRPPGEIVDAAASCDVGVVALRGENENERRASTSKLFTYMAAGLAILGSDLPGIARIVKRHENGVLVGGMRPADWAAAIEALVALPDAAIDRLKRRSLEAAHLYAWEGQRPAFLAEFTRALRLAGGEAVHGD